MKLKQSQDTKRGISLVELIVTIGLMAIVGIYALTNILGHQQKQKLTDTVIQLQSAIDTARTRAIAAAPDSTGNPSTWGVYLFSTSSKDGYTVGPYNDTAFNATPPSSETKYLATSYKFSNTNRRMLILFDKLSGDPHIYRPPLASYPNWQPQLTITITNSRWQQSVTLDGLGNSTHTTIKPR